MYANFSDEEGEETLPKEEPFIQAVRKGDIQKVSDFLKDNIDPNITSCVDELTALHIASQKGNIEIVELLIKHGADVNKSFQDEDYNIITPLETAINSRHFDIAQLLLENGAKINSTEDRALLFRSLDADAIEVARLLIEAGIDINKKYGKYKPLFHALKKYNGPEAFRLLLEKGATIGDKDKYSDYLSEEDDKVLKLALLVDKIYLGKEIKDSNSSEESGSDSENEEFSDVDKEKFISARLLGLILQDARKSKFDGNAVAKVLKEACLGGYITKELESEIQKGYLKSIIDALYYNPTSDFSFLDSYPYDTEVIKGLIERLQKTGLPSGCTHINSYKSYLSNIPANIKSNIELQLEKLGHALQELDSSIIKIFYNTQGNLTPFLSDSNPHQLECRKVFNFFRNKELSKEQKVELITFQKRFNEKRFDENSQESLEFYKEIYLKLLTYLKEEKILNDQELSNLIKSPTAYELGFETIKTFLLYTFYPDYIDSGNVSLEFLEDASKLGRLVGFIRESDPLAPETVRLLELLQIVPIKREIKKSVSAKLKSLKEPINEFDMLQENIEREALDLEEGEEKELTNLFDEKSQYNQEVLISLEKCTSAEEEREFLGMTDD